MAAGNGTAGTTGFDLAPAGFPEGVQGRLGQDLREVEVLVLGAVEVRGNARQFTRAWAKELVIYLAMHPDGVSNDTWATALWPDRLMAASSLHSTASVRDDRSDGRVTVVTTFPRATGASFSLTPWERTGIALSDLPIRVMPATGDRQWSSFVAAHSTVFGHRTGPFSKVYLPPSRRQLSTWQPGWRLSALPSGTRPAPSGPPDGACW